MTYYCCYEYDAPSYWYSPPNTPEPSHCPHCGSSYMIEEDTRLLEALSRHVDYPYDSVDVYDAAEFANLPYSAGTIGHMVEVFCGKEVLGYGVSAMRPWFTDEGWEKYGDGA